MPRLGGAAFTSRRRPCGHATSSYEVEAAEQHGEFRPIEHHAVGVRRNGRDPKTTLRKPLVIENETSAVPEQYLDAVSSATDEDEEVTVEGVHPKACPNERGEPVVSTAEIHRLQREVDPDPGCNAQHWRRSAETIDAT